MKIKMAGIAKISARAIHKYEFASLSILPNRALAAATIPNIPAAMVKKITETETQEGHILNIK